VEGSGGTGRFPQRAESEQTSRTPPYPPGMRTMFVVYLIVIVAGLVFYSVIGITHN
jgi:hypothetical protein